jgi:thioredoxin 1
LGAKNDKSSGRLDWYTYWIVFIMASFKEITNSNKHVLVDFHATWCGPCKTMAPILEDVKQKAPDSLRVVKIDVDKNQRLAEKLQVRGVPTLILYKDGEQVWRQSGVVPADAILARLN